MANIALPAVMSALVLTKDLRIVLSVCRTVKCIGSFVIKRILGAFLFCFTKLFWSMLGPLTKGIWCVLRLSEWNGKERFFFNCFLNHATIQISEHYFGCQRYV